MLENSAQIVDALRVRLGVETDSAVAAALGVHHTSIVHYRTGRTSMSPELAMKAAGLLGVEPGPLVLVCLAETDARRKPATAALFRQLAERLRARPGRRRIVAAVLTAITVGAAMNAAPVPANAATPAAFDRSIHYANRQRRRRTWRPRRRLSVSPVAA